MRKLPKYKYLYGILDLLIISGSFIFAAYVVRRNYDIHFFEFIAGSIESLLIFPFFAGVFVFIFDFNDLYKINIVLTRAAHVTSLIKSYIYGIFVVILVAYLNKSALLDSRLLTLTFSLTSFPLLYLFRVEIFRILFKKLGSTRFRRKVVIIGDGKSAKLLAAKLHMENSIGIDMKGFVVENKSSEENIHGKKILGHISRIKEITEQYDIDEIIIAVDSIDYDHLLKLLDICHELQATIRVSSDLFRIVHEKLRTEKYIDIPIVDINPKYNTLISFVLKRFFDLLLSLILFVLLIPVFLLIGLLIKLSSPGPILFVQRRIGKNGTPFNFYKFRSMDNLSKEDEHRKTMMIEFMRNGNNQSDTKIVDETRITKIGRLLRKTSMDELPQLINVIKGEMSLVGPRPCLPYEYENYDNWQKRRLDVLPGCTGVWQTSGRSSVSFIDSIVLDLYYINNMSPWLDLKLVLKTIPVMIFSRGGK